MAIIGNTKGTAREIAYDLEGTDAGAILAGGHYRSFCQGSDRLVALGLWNNDGELSDLGFAVRAILAALDHNS